MGFLFYPEDPPVDCNAVGRKGKLIKMENHESFISSSNSEKRNILFIKFVDEFFKLHSTKYLDANNCSIHSLSAYSFLGTVLGTVCLPPKPISEVCALVSILWIRRQSVSQLPKVTKPMN